MNTLNRLYLVLCLSVTGWFATAAYQGWKTAPLASQSPSNSRHSTGGVFIPYGGGGGRSSGGSWGGGK